MRGGKPGECELCEREALVTFHHLIPRTLHSNKWFKKRFDRQRMQSGLELCDRCHNYLHREYSAKELGRHLNSREALLADDKVGRFVAWMRRRG